MRSRIVLLIIFLFIVFLSPDIGWCAGEANATGGYITNIELEILTQTLYWQGFIGQITFGVGADTPSGVNASGGNISTQNFFLSATCNNPTSLSGFVFFANTSSAPIGLSAGNLTFLDSLVTNGSDAPSSTFTSTSSYFLGGSTINSVPTVYPFVDSASQSSSFKEGYLQDSSDNLVFVTAVEQDALGYNSSTFDFQVIIPILKNATPTSYSLYADLVYTCPECNDGIDNDGDGLIDFPADPGCSDASDNDESDAVAIIPGVGVDRGPGGGGEGWDPRYASARTVHGIPDKVVPEEAPKKEEPKAPIIELPKPFSLEKLPREITIEYLLESLIPIIIRLILIVCLWIVFSKKRPEVLE